MPRAAFSLTGSRPGVIRSPAAFEDLGFHELGPEPQPNGSNGTHAPGAEHGNGSDTNGGLPAEPVNGADKVQGLLGSQKAIQAAKEKKAREARDHSVASLQLELEALAQSPNVVILNEDGTPQRKDSVISEGVSRVSSGGANSSNNGSDGQSTRNSCDEPANGIPNGSLENGVYNSGAKLRQNGKTGMNGFAGQHGYQNGAEAHDLSGPLVSSGSLEGMVSTTTTHRGSVTHVSKGVASRRNLFTLITAEDGEAAGSQHRINKESSFNSFADSAGPHTPGPFSSQQDPSNRDQNVEASFVYRSNLVGLNSPVSAISGHRRSSCGSSIDAQGFDRKGSSDQNKNDMSRPNTLKDPMAARRALLHAGAFHASLLRKSSTTLGEMTGLSGSEESMRSFIKRVSSEPQFNSSGHLHDLLVRNRSTASETDSDYFPYQDEDGSLLPSIVRTSSIPELRIRRRKLRDAHIEEWESTSIRSTTSWVSEQSAFLSAASSTSSTKMTSEGGGAERLVLQTVVNQLQYGKIPAASSAAAAVEYLVSSSEPKQAGPPSLGGWRWTFEGAKLNREALGQFPGLFDSLLRVLKEGTGEACAKVCGAMSKLGFRNTANVLAMIKHPGILEALNSLLGDERGPKVQVQAWRVLQNCVSGIDEVKVILCQNEELLEHMKKAVANDSPDEKQQEIRMRAVSVIMHASSNDIAKQHLLNARMPEDGLSLVLSSNANTQQASATRIRATLASANLCGREERSILSTAPEMLMEIVKCVSHALDETEYCGIKWSLAGVALPLFNLSCSDSNKISLINCGVVELLLKIIQDETISAEPLEFALRSLANFTFNDEAKQQMLDQEILDILDSMVVSIGEKNQKAKSVVKDLVYMLSENQAMDAEEEEDKPISQDDEWHIMISYSWAEKKNHVEDLTVMLRNKGYSVWRDEEGSELVQKMMGSSMEIMAKAIEVAKFVIVFVSRAYRDSYNCKLEGKYAQQRERAGLVKILFVMMEEDYTPQSECGVDGWLGMMIADAIWYCGWNYEGLGTTADALQKVIEKTLAEQARDHSTLTRTQSSVPRAPSVMPGGKGGNIAEPTGPLTAVAAGRPGLNMSSHSQHSQSRLKSSSLTPVIEAPTNDTHSAWRAESSISSEPYIPPHLASQRRFSSPTNEKYDDYKLNPEISKWLSEHSLAELESAFCYHRIDSMKVVGRLSESQIESITDRVGLQVRLHDAVAETAKKLNLHSPLLQSLHHSHGSPLRGASGHRNSLL